MLSPYRTKTLKEKQTKTPKIDTYATTLSYIRKHMPVEDIAKIRELTPGTIRSHIFKLHEQDPTLDIAYLRPAESMINLVTSAVHKSQIKSN